MHDETAVAGTERELRAAGHSTGPSIGSRSVRGLGLAARIAALAALALPVPALEASAAPAQDAEQAPQAPQAPQANGKLRYVQAGPNGARARNLYDAAGVVVRNVPEGTILAVHGERAGWLEVEAPGGFQVWVYGKYVRPADEAGALKITATNVRMRPLASSGPESMPLPQKLDLGDTVRLIRRNDTDLPLAEDWVQVWSPPGARAWVRAAETVPVSSGADGARLWGQAVASSSAAAAASAPAVADLGATGESSGAARPAAAPAAAQDAARASELLHKANQLLDAERQREEQGGQPNYAAVVKAYEDVLAATSGGPTADMARGRIQLAKSYAEAHQIRIDLENQKLDYEEQLARREDEKAAARDRDVFEGRFAERGWLERRASVVEGDDPIWVLRYAGGDAAQLVCASGRYDLGLFADFEIGINGAVVRARQAGAVGQPARPPLIDVAALEVIAGRRRR